MQASVESLAALVFYSPAVAPLVAFYRDVLGVPLASAEHGDVGPHFEGSLGGVHVAMWGEERHMSGPVVPVFRARGLAAAGARLVTAGARSLHGPVELGDGKRVAGFLDPEGRPLRLIEIRSGDAPPRAARAPSPAHASAVSAVVLTSPTPGSLAAFLEQGLGVRFRASDHAGTPDHFEARLGDVRFAILQGAAAPRGAVAPTLLVGDLDAAVAALHRRGVEATSSLVLGPKKRLASFLDPDRNPFHLVEVRA